MRTRYIVAIPVCLVLTWLITNWLRWPGSVGDVPQTVADQRAQWAAHQPPQYILTVTHNSGAAPNWFTLSLVKGGKVDNVLCRQYKRDDSIVECPVSEALYPITIEQVFAAIETGYRSKIRGIDVQYQAASPAGVAPSHPADCAPQSPPCASRACRSVWSIHPCGPAAPAPCGCRCRVLQKAQPSTVKQTGHQPLYLVQA
jgi:hypothetical protein